MPRKPLIPNRDTAILVGVATYLLGVALLWDAYEHRGKSRPFWQRFLP